jgi:acetyl esterase/lipase
MTARAISVATVALCACLCNFAGAQQLVNARAFPLWPGAAPYQQGATDDDIPTLTPYLPSKQVATGAAFIVCPGGGYVMLADHEGAPVAEWLAGVGITAFVLRYRHAPKYHQPVPMLDAQRAIRYVRAHAAQWGLDGRVGILGFSAGGHLASTAGTHFDAGNPNAPDPTDRVSSRPDLMVLVYPVITMDLEPTTHVGSRQALLGPNPSPQLMAFYTGNLNVSDQTPPTFLVHGADDRTVPVENSLKFAAALREHKVPFELHIFEHGPHGFGLGGREASLAQWPALCVTWLRLHQFAARLEFAQP